MTRPLLIMPIEIKVREFHAKLLLALTAAERGYDVLLAGQEALLRSLEFLDRGIYLDKSIAVTKEAWFARVRRLGNVPVAWDEEGLVFCSAWAYRTGRVHVPSLAQTARFFAWGPVQAEAILEKAPEARDRVCVTGNPRFDLLRPEWRAFYAARARPHHAQYGRLILLNTNFGYVNHFKGDAGLQAILARYPLTAEHAYQAGWRAFQQTGFDAFRALVPVLARACPDHTLIVRPSPSESVAPWEALAAPHANVAVRSDGNVDDWIPAADAVVHFNCTTGVEAFLLGVPAVAYRAAVCSDYESELPNGVSRHAFSAEEVVACVRAAVSDAADRSDCFADTAARAQWRRLAVRYIEGLEGAPAAERILDALGALPPVVRARPWTQRLNAVKCNAWPWIVRRIRRRDRFEAGYERRKFAGLEAAEVRAGIAALHAVSGRFAGIRVRDMGRTRFLITEES
jgi:surface carbohydrate biosynthesis protein